MKEVGKNIKETLNRHADEIFELAECNVELCLNLAASNFHAFVLIAAQKLAPNNAEIFISDCYDQLKQKTIKSIPESKQKYEQAYKEKLNEF